MHCVAWLEVVGQTRTPLCSGAPAESWVTRALEGHSVPLSQHCWSDLLSLAAGAAAVPLSAAAIGRRKTASASASTGRSVPMPGVTLVHDTSRNASSSMCENCAPQGMVVRKMSVGIGTMWSC